MFRFDEPRALGGFFESHAYDSGSGKYGIVEFNRGEGVHLFCPVRISACVEFNSVDGDDIPDALLGAVKKTFRFYGLNRYTAYFKSVMRTACECLRVCDYPAVRFFGAQLNLIVVAMLMRDENNVGGHVVTLARIWVYINDAPVGGGQPKTAMPLIYSFGISRLLINLFPLPVQR
jgi:hypothetical protein